MTGWICPSEKPHGAYIYSIYRTELIKLDRRPVARNVDVYHLNAQAYNARLNISGGAETGLSAVKRSTVCQCHGIETTCVRRGRIFSVANLGLQLSLAVKEFPKWSAFVKVMDESTHALFMSHYCAGLLVKRVT